MSRSNSDEALLAACEAALAWVDAIQQDDGTEDLDQLYWRWVHLMRAAVGGPRGLATSIPYTPTDGPPPRCMQGFPKDRVP